jgi:hypothetical protein
MYGNTASISFVNTMNFIFRAKKKGEVLLKHINEKAD